MIKWIAVVVAATAMENATSAGQTELFYAKSLYRNIMVYEQDGLRCMKFGRNTSERQSCVHVLDHDKLVFGYTKTMMAALYLNPEPKRILIVGLGGGILPSTLRKLLPSSQIDIVEIDPTVSAVAKRFFHFSPTDKTNVYENDGRVFAKRALKQKVKYDLVMLDAFDHQYIPEHMLTREFLREVRELLAERGVLAANTFSTSKLYNHESATYYSVFGDFYSLQKGNRVILLRIGGLPAISEIAENAALLEDRLRPFGTGKSELLSLFTVEREWPADTKILTDQYSPSNLLNARPQ